MFRAAAFLSAAAAGASAASGGFLEPKSNTSVQAASSSSCCSGCQKDGFCSPFSWHCYTNKTKDYYEDCSKWAPPVPQCCDDCAGKLGFFSTISGNCYKTKKKDYYQACPKKEPSESAARDNKCKVGGDNWCAAVVPDDDFSLRACPNNGMRVKALTYNLFWWNLFGQRHGNDGSAGKLVREAGPFDIVGFQECDVPGWIMGDATMNVTKDWDYVRWGSNTLAFRKTRFETVAVGDGEVVAQDFGHYSYRRGAHWVRLNEIGTGKKLFVMNHHGPLPVNTGGVCGGRATAYNLMRMIKENSQAGDGILLMGDFNAESWSETVQTLGDYMHHLMSDWVDNFFSNCGKESVRESRSLGNGGSDHNAIMTVIDF